MHQPRRGVNSTKSSSCDNDNDVRSGVHERAGEREGDPRDQEAKEAGGWRRVTKEEGSEERGNGRNGSSLWSSDSAARKKREAS